LGFGCTVSQPVSLGSNGEIAVVTDAEPGDPRLEALLTVLGEPVRCFRGEPRFRPSVVPPAGFDACRHARCLAFLLDLDAPGGLAGPLRHLLARADLESMRAEPYAFRVVQNAWACGQSVLVVHARGAQGAVALGRGGHEMIAVLEEGITGALVPVVLEGGEDRAVGERLARDFGFTLRVPRGWLLGGDPARGVARLYRVDERNGARFLLIAVSPADRAPCDPDSLLALRERLAAAWGDGDHIDPLSSAVRAGSFQRRPATFVEGIWQNANYSIGGLFRSCAFVRGGRSFLVDAAVFQPREEKLPILREVVAIAGTFRLVEEP
jgi:hypothetical protein